MRLWLTSLCICLILGGNAFAGSGDIHRMVVGDSVLELQETTRLTSLHDGAVEGAWISPDGKYVTYLANNPKDARLCAMRTSGGGSDLLLTYLEPDSGLADPATETWMPQVSAEGPVAWSCDSKLIAFPVRHFAPGPTEQTWENCILVMTPTGQRRALFNLPEDTRPTGLIMWSPDSRRLACEVWCLGFKGESRHLNDVFVFDLQGGSSQNAFHAVAGDSVLLDSWSADSRSLRYYAPKAKPKIGWEQWESTLDGKPDVLIQEVDSILRRSPDGRLQLTDKPGLSIEDCSTGEVTQVLKEFPGKFLQWSPDSKMLSYTDSQVITDKPGDRTRKLNTIWLAIPQSRKKNHMCVALDADEYSKISFSRDCTKIVYIQQHRVYLAELVWAPLTVDDKLAAGIPLSEEEEKEILVNNAKQIGVAALMYASDHGDQSPSGDGFMDDMDPYTRGGSGLFYRPGTQNMVFQYFSLGNLSNMTNSAKTVMGMFDVGYGWKVILYADGHVRTVPK